MPHPWESRLLASSAALAAAAAEADLVVPAADSFRRALGVLPPLDVPAPRAVTAAFKALTRSFPYVV